MTTDINPNELAINTIANVILLRNQAAKFITDNGIEKVAIDICKEYATKLRKAMESEHKYPNSSSYLEISGNQERTWYIHYDRVSFDYDDTVRFIQNGYSGNSDETVKSFDLNEVTELLKIDGVDIQIQKDLIAANLLKTQYEAKKKEENKQQIARLQAELNRLTVGGI